MILPVEVDEEQTADAQVVRLYLIVLGRQPDMAGLEAYAGHLRNGQTLEDIASAFIASEEFHRVAGNEAAPVVMYRNAYGTLPAPGWLATNRQSPVALAVAFVRDPVVISHLPAHRRPGRDVDPWATTAQVVLLYLVVLGRRPDPVGLAAYVEHRRAGLPLEEIAAAFIASDEFRARAGDEDAALALYRNAHGISPSLDWVSANMRHPEAVATSLIAEPAVVRRLSVLEALYPDGIPVDDTALYRRWLSELAQPDAQEREAMLRDSSVPSVSWVILLDDPRPEWLDAAITSVRTQSAPGVELLLVSRHRFCRTARRHAREDTRVHLIRGLLWDRRARLLSRALAACHGEFMGVLGQHDLLHNTAGYEIAFAAASADVIIGDEDAVDTKGLRHSPRFGVFCYPDSLPDTLRPDAAVVRTSLVRAAKGLGAGPDDTQVADPLLRVVMDLNPGRLRHVPVLLRSRRDSPMTTHQSGAAPGEARRLRWLRHAVPAPSSSRLPSMVSPVPAQPPLASIIIATRDHASLLRTCLQGVLERTDYPALEVLVLDNASREEATMTLLAQLGSDARVRVLRNDGAFNWSALNNTGVQEMRGEIAVLLNNDIEVVANGWLRALILHVLRPDVGIVGAKLLYPDHTIQHAGMVLGPAGRATHMWRHSDGCAAGYMNQLLTTRDVTAVTGACVAMRRDVYKRVGGLEESLPITWSDVDLCLRVREFGLRVIWTPHAVLLHHEQASRGTDNTPQGQARLAREREWMMQRWGRMMDVDPFLSPNMLPSEAEMLLAPVPRRLPSWQKVL